MSALPAHGAHELIVESSSHVAGLTELSIPEITLVLTVYRDRLNVLRTHSGLAYGLLFKNSGPLAGASVQHVHSQIVALPFVPPTIQLELQTSSHHAAEGRGCIYCSMLGRESADGRRIIWAGDHFVALCPYASRFAWECWILPRQHQNQFQQLADEQCPELARLLRDILRRLESVLPTPAYNYILHTAPFDTTGADHYHWHIEILPRTAQLAGFELGGGVLINTVLPERAAADLRSAREFGEGFPAKRRRKSR